MILAAALSLGLARPAAAAADLGGHKLGHEHDLIAEPAPADERRATLEELWQRGLLPPDQSAWSPADQELLQKIRAAENDALVYLRRRFGTYRAWVARPRDGRGLVRLTKEGYEKYMTLLSQDAIKYFEEKGADAKWVFKLRDMDGKALFDPTGRLTPEGVRVHRRAILNLEVFWTSPDGETFGTRRPPTKNP